MKRYLRLLRIFYENTLLNEMEYRVNFWSNIGVSLFWLVWAALSVRVYFFHADDIAGWHYNEVLIVMGLFFAMNGFRQMLLTPNLSRLSEYVQMGTLDYILLKPIDSQFLVSLRHIGVFNWSDPLLGLGLVGFALWRLKQMPNPAEVLLFLLVFAAGLLILYSVSLILQTTTIWLVNVQRMDTIIQGLLETGRFPTSFYQGWIGTILTVVVPVAFMTSFPAQALLGRLEFMTALGGIGLAGGLFVAASLFWRIALRSYTSVSS
jgi:ABC-2 type transport system permease protein